MATMNKPAQNSTTWYTAVTDNWTSIENNIIDTALFKGKGELLVATGSASPVTLAPSSPNQVLAADSAQTQGVKWAGVNSARLIRSYRARATTSTSTSSSSFVDMDSMSLTIAVAAHEKVLVFFNSCIGRSGGSAVGGLRILRNTSEIRRMDFSIGSDSSGCRGSLFVNTLDQPGAGSHTYKIQWKTDYSLDQELSPYSTNGDRELVLMVLPG